MPPSTFSTDELTDLKKNYDYYRASHPAKPKAAPTRKKPGGVAGFLQGLIPLAGGALGALAGIPLGPAGIIAGGAAGSSGGEFLKQKLQGGPIDKGDIVEQGIFGAIPGVGSGIKALRAGAGAASLIGRGGEQVAAQTASNAVRAGSSPATRLYNKGVITEARSGGFGQGEKVTGGSSQGFRESEKISKTLTKENIPGASPSTRQQMVGDRLEQHGKTIGAAIDAKNVAVDEHRLADIIGRVEGRIIGENGKGVTGFIPGNKAQMDIANNYVRQLSGVKDARGLHNFKKALDEDAINYGRNSMAPDPVKEQIAKVFRQEVNKDFGELVPEAKAANKAYADLHDANELLKQAARDASNNATQAGGGIAGRVLTSDTATAAKSKAGRGMQTLGRLMGGQSGGEVVGEVAPAATRGTAGQILHDLTSVRKVAGAGVKQAIPRAVGAGLGIGVEAPATGEVPPEPLMDSSNVDGSLLQNAALNSASQGQTYSRENMLADVKRDPKNAKTYLDLYKELAPEANNGLNVTKVTAQQYGLAQAGSQALQQLGQLIQEDPNVVTRTATPGRNLPVVGGFVTNAAGVGDYDAIGYNIADSILRLRTGATANESEVKKLQAQIMPRAGDSPETIATKMQQIQSIFGNVLDLAGSQSGTSDANLTDLQGTAGL